MSENLSIKTQTGLISEDGIENAPSGLNALVVDDSSTGRRIIHALLTVMGFKIFEADGPSQAMTLVSEHMFSLITVDRFLGDFDGVDLVKDLRAHKNCGNDSRILAVTGNVGKEHREAFFKAGADAFLNKPFTVKELAEMLKALGFIVND